MALSSPEECRIRADACDRAADEATTLESRQIMRVLAGCWRKLADRDAHKVRQPRGGQRRNQPSAE
jgi:hypothetical protein